MRPHGTTRTARLKRLLTSPELAFLMEAHSGLSARIAEEAGFKAIWASGLSISAALGVRDANEASWTQVLDVVEFMADAVEAPILLDGDTGYGNFNNVRRLVAKLESRGVAGVCIEDKLFPKTNSFLHGEAQPLAAIDEFCGRIRAGKDAQRDNDFVIVARTEAFIAGRGLTEAIDRAHAYADAGADAILIHSSRKTPDEVLSFRQAWDRALPVIAVPTKYCDTPTAVFRRHRFAALIWANHLLRAGIEAMQAAAAQIFAEQSVSRIDGAIAPVTEVFRLQRVDELEAAERRYLGPPLTLRPAVNQ
jgi:phosphoenolpyruvate phosphomutase